MQRLLWCVRFIAVTLVAISPITELEAHALQLEPTIRDQVLAAAVLVAVPVVWIEDDVESLVPLPIGSGTIVSPDGLVLTNYHVVDPKSFDEQLAQLQTAISEERPSVTLRRLGPEFVLLGSDGTGPPSPVYFAVLGAEDQDRDIAVLQITAYADRERQGEPVSRTPFVPTGDSDKVNLGDRVQVFAFPAIGGDSLTYTTGVISGFGFDDESGEREWISTDAVMSAGSSGGTAVNDDGRLIGIPTAGSELDCRAGDTNRDGTIDENDVGCIPVGGSLGLLVPVNDALDLMAGTGLLGAATKEREPAVESTVVPAPILIPVSTTIAESPSPSFSFVERFDDPRAFQSVDDSESAVSIINSTLRIEIKAPGVIVTYDLPDRETNGADAGLEAAVESTRGWGEVIVLARTETDEEWYFSIDPVAQTWSLYRNSIDTGLFFYWIEPITYAGLVNNTLRSVEVSIAGGRPSLLINGTDIADAQNIPLPDMRGNVVFGFGAGINPESLSGSGQTFEVAFDYLILSER